MAGNAGMLGEVKKRRSRAIVKGKVDTLLQISVKKPTTTGS